MALGFGLRSSLWAEDRRIVTLFVDGEEMILPTHAQTVGELLDRAQVTYHEQDLIEPALDAAIVGDTFNINVYRARPVTVVDDTKKFVVMSPYQSSRRIVEAAGLDVRDEDEFELERIDEILAESALGLKLTIDRAQPAIINLYGKRIEVYTQAETVEELLAEKEIAIAADDNLRPAANTPLVAGTEVVVARVGTDIITEEKPIEYGEEVIQDSSLTMGTRKIRTPGVLGSETITYQIELENGQEISRSVLQKVTLKEPKPAVVMVGTKAPEFVGGSQEDWMRAAGIPESFWYYVDAIVTKESGWNPNAVNASSGACGLGQQLPCGKWAGQWNDPIAALQGMSGYVQGRYGGWEGAYAFWNVNRWY